MPRTVVDPKQQRELRRQIGRLRRRIDGRVRAVGSEAGRLLSWRTYVKRYPGHAVTAAFGVGLAASTGLKPGRISRWLAATLLQKTSEQIGRQFWKGLERIWADWSKEDSGADDGRA